MHGTVGLPKEPGELSGRFGRLAAERADLRRGARSDQGRAGETIDATYAIGQRMIFGNDVGKGAVSGKLFGYLLDYDEPFAYANSSQIYGGFLAVANPIEQRASASVRASYALQSHRRQPLLIMPPITGLSRLGQAGWVRSRSGYGDARNRQRPSGPGAGGKLAQVQRLGRCLFDHAAGGSPGWLPIAWQQGSGTGRYPRTQCQHRAASLPQQRWRPALRR